ncbi:MAG TPA: hypothetical protein VMT24_18445 [Aggregatilineaceae bacterium]|nr:hypothetical protein [Aggregatilineaceae bacterium]
MNMTKPAILAGALLVMSTLFSLALANDPTPRALTPVASMPAVSAPAPTPTTVNLTPLPPTVAGIVVGENGPVADAIVQIQATPEQVHTDSKGAFTLTGISGTTPIIITAWSAGHYVGWTTVNPSDPGWTGGQDIKITLKPVPETDNLNYAGFSFEGVSGSAACGLCHREYKEWQVDAHSRAATNAHFLAIYTGTDANGQAGQPMQIGLDGTPLPPDPSLPYHGPGFLLDNPARAGNCATCHTPLASKTSNQQNCAWSGCHTSLTVERATGVIGRPALPVNLHGEAAEGISCDFCHKIGDVILDPKTNLPYPDMPGILSLKMYRPADGQQVFFGTLVDVNRRDTYLPLETKSQFCAGCHYGVFGGVVGMGDVKGGTTIYNSYGEWLASRYSDPKTGLTCQQCHMLVSSAKWFVFPDRGGLVRDYVQLHDHTMPGIGDTDLLQHAVTMNSTAQRSGDQVQVKVSITNDQTGHDVPTDDPSRSVILVVEALDANGKPPALSQGPVNPAYAGNFGGLPGKTFAKVLKDDWTGETPTAAIWRPVSIVEDTRLVAMATDTTVYTFKAPAGTAVTINVRLMYRRAFAELMKQKGWTDPDILMANQTLQVPAN